MFLRRLFPDGSFVISHEEDRATIPVTLKINVFKKRSPKKLLIVNALLTINYAFPFEVFIEIEDNTALYYNIPITYIVNKGVIVCVCVCLFHIRRRDKKMKNKVSSTQGDKTLF